MTTTAPTRSSTSVSTTTRWSFGGVVSSEFTKLITLRSTFVISLVMIVISVTFSALVASTYGSAEAVGRPASGATSSSVGASVSFAQLIIGVLAVVLVTNEYSTNMIQTTLAATPRRFPVLAAKLVVATVVTLILSLVSSLLGYAVAAPILSRTDLLASLSDAIVVGSIAASALYLVFVAWFAVTTASILRNSAAGIAVVAGIFFVLPIVLSLVPLGDVHLDDYILGSSGQVVSRSIWDADFGDDFALNLGLTIAWLVAPAVAAFGLLAKRDA